MKAVFFAGALLASVASAAEPPATIWQPYSDSIFEQPKHQHRFVLLDLEAVWCHWCHVTDEITYRDPGRIELINARYLAVKVEQDFAARLFEPLRRLRLARDGCLQQRRERDRQAPGRVSAFIKL